MTLPAISSPTLPPPSPVKVPVLPIQGQPQGNFEKPIVSDQDKELIDQGIAPPRKKGNDAQGQPQGDKEPAEDLESFSKIDPNTLSPELKSIYNSMLTDYKRKMEEISKTRTLISSETRDKIIHETLDNLTDSEFEFASQHPVFINRLNVISSSKRAMPWRAPAFYQRPERGTMRICSLNSSS